MISTTSESDLAAFPAKAEKSRNGASGATQEHAGPTPEIQALPIQQFIWGAGMECSFLPHMKIDQFLWTQHDRFWKEDLRRAKQDAGINNMRYAFPWHVLEPERGKFNWDYADQRMAEFDKLGINLLLDVMHFGTPTYLKQAVGDPEFPEALERFTDAMVRRYSHQVKIWCPFNEPLVSALFSGDLGFWPPYQRKWRGYMPVLTRVVQGVSRGIRAIRAAAPECTVLLCDASENYRTRVESLQPEVRRRNLRRFVVMDLLTGRVDRGHPLYKWLNNYGMSELDLAWFRNNPEKPDILGLDYYPHSDWQLEIKVGVTKQRRADNPVGLYGVGTAYWNRYNIPLMLTETSIDGKPINREIWLDRTIDDIRQLREDGIPMLGFIWWPLLDQLDWDGAMTHRIGKIHEVGLFNLHRQPDGTLKRNSTPLIKMFKAAMEAGESRIGKLEKIVYAADVDGLQVPLSTSESWEELEGTAVAKAPAADQTIDDADQAAGVGGEVILSKGIQTPKRKISPRTPAQIELEDSRATDRYGIVVFSHLRWGFVWQRPQQFLSRFAKKHSVLFIEEPFFDRPEGEEPELQFHRVMANVTVACPHLAPSWNTNPKLPELLRKYAHQAIKDMNDSGEFDKPLLWYYSPMDSSWSLGHFENRGIVYDSMDELSQFTGAPPSLIANEKRLMDHSDVVFTGGYELYLKKKQQHPNVHFFGCGVEFEHFNQAQDPATSIPPDIDFMNRPILGWFGVVDERVDYNMVGEMARMRPEWSFAMVGPVVKVDPNLLPHFPNLYWLGGRDYSVLPNYCRAFDVNMMCFAINAATQFINPTKALEYLATGKPVISTPVKDVVTQYSDTVEIVKTAEEFVLAAERAMQTPDKARIARGLEKAQQSSWESTVKTMQDIIKDAVSKTDRPSSKKVEALPEFDEKAYEYLATQGS
jgi:beta-glucosidase/6-phospho-beta-glucosidase/beta-galactosidase/glycosyltransferase involved in cell wall biosynthesis